jgi:hypothetical protein
MKHLASKGSILSTLHFDDETSLRNDYERLKTHAFKPKYGLHVPPQGRTIAKIYDVLSELSSQYQEIVVFAVDAISFDYYLDGIRRALPKGAGEGVLPHRPHQLSQRPSKSVMSLSSEIQQSPLIK